MRSRLTHVELAGGNASHNRDTAYPTYSDRAQHTLDTPRIDQTHTRINQYRKRINPESSLSGVCRVSVACLSRLGGFWEGSGAVLGRFWTRSDLGASGVVSNHGCCVLGSGTRKSLEHTQLPKDMPEQLSVRNSSSTDERNITINYLRKELGPVDRHDFLEEEHCWVSV